MRYTLKDYQVDAVADILANLQEARDLYRDGRLSTMSLTASTGGGKTVIAAAVIEALFYGNDEFEFESDPGAVVLWFSDDPTLNTQSRHRLGAAAPDLLGRMTDLDAGYTRPELVPRNVYFVNTHKFAKGSRMVRGFQPSAVEGQDTLDGLDPQSRPDMVPQTVYDIIAATIANPDLTLYFFLDEAHKGMGTTARAQAEQKTIVKRLIAGQGPVPPMPVVFGISATLERFTNAMDGIRGRLGLTPVQVDPVRVQESGLLKDNILLNIPHPDEVGSFETVLLRSAVRQLLESEAAWDEYVAEQRAEHPESEIERVVPLMVLQTPNSVTEEQIAWYIQTILEVWPDMPFDAVAHVLSEKEMIHAGGVLIPHIEPERVQEQTRIRVLIAKEAVTTGWDCPRAEVLMSFRTVSDLTKITQTLGRMVRTPLARRIPGNDELNSVLCLLPNFDEKTARQVVEDLTGNTGDDGRDDYEDEADAYVPSPGDAGGAPASAAHGHVAQGEGRGHDAHDTVDAADSRPDTPGAPSTPGAPAAPRPRYRDEDEAIDPVNAGTGGGRGRKVLTDRVDVRPIDDDDLWGLFESLPTETTPSRGLRPVRLLTALGQHLSEDGLRPDAGEEAHRYLHRVLDARRTQFAEDVDAAVKDILEVRVRTIRADRLTGKERVGMFTERADLAVVREAFNRAGRSFSQDLARTYVNHLVGPDATEPDLRDAYAQVAGMAAVPDIVEDLDVEAQRLVDRWFKAHRADIKTLSDARQAVYADLLSMTPQPRRSALRKPVIWQEPLTFTDKNGRKVPLPMRTDHALLSEDGTYPARLNAWERQVVEAEMTRPGAVAWFRNPDRVNVASLAVAYQDGGETWRTLRPDFIFFRRDAQGTLRASIIDPHGTHLSDALPKLQGLARFAEQYGGEFMRIEAAAQVDGVLKVLDMRDERVRDAVESAPSAAALYAGPLAHEY